MPGTKLTTYKKKSYKKKPYKKRKYKLPPLLMPNYVVVRAKYVDHHTFDAAVGSVQFAPYGANCLYDPYLSAGGHQVRGFDEWMTLYNNAVVIKSTCKIRAMPDESSAGGQIPGLLYIIKSRDGGRSNTVSNAADLMESNMIGPKSSVIYGNHGALAYNPSNKAISAYNSFSTRKWFHVKDLTDRDDLSNTSGSNPTDICYYEVGQININTNNPSAVDVQVELEYTIMYYNPIFVQSS